MPSPVPVAAYLATVYRLTLPGDAAGVELRVGQRSPELAGLYRQHGQHSVAYVTACNPMGAELPADANRQATDALRRELQAQGLPFLEGAGSSPDGRWREESFGIFGLSRPQARELGARLRQLAIVWAGADAVPQLEVL